MHDRIIELGSASARSARYCGDAGDGPASTTRALFSGACRALRQRASDGFPGDRVPGV